jgi:hypothetical protein
MHSVRQSKFLATLTLWQPRKLVYNGKTAKTRTFAQDKSEWLYIFVTSEETIELTLTVTFKLDHALVRNQLNNRTTTINTDSGDDEYQKNKHLLKNASIQQKRKRLEKLMANLDTGETCKDFICKCLQRK